MVSVRVIQRSDSRSVSFYFHVDILFPNIDRSDCPGDEEKTSKALRTVGCCNIKNAEK